MNVKQFPKPDWRKIVIFIIIFIVLSFMPIWTTIQCSSWECGPGPSSSSFLNSIESMKNKEFFDYGYLTIWAGILFGSLILSFILSNLIVWIYDKFRNKKK